MPNSFTVNSGSGAIGIQANPKRSDGTAGTFPVNPSWSISPSDGSLGTIATQFAGSGTRINFTPKSGSNGVATVTCSGKDENGGAVSSSATVNVVTDPNPTQSYDFVQIPAG